MRILHTMLRVGDLQRSIRFYQDVLGMRLLRTSENPEYKYSLAFLGYDDEDKTSVLELTYNWGVDKYDLGNAYVTSPLAWTIFTPLVKRCARRAAMLRANRAR